MRLTRIALLAVVVHSAAAPISAEPWSLKKLFTKETTTTKKLYHKENSGKQVLGGKKVNGNVKRANPLSSVSAGTQRLMSKTKSLFTPGKKSKPEVRKVTGRQAVRSKNKKAPAKKESMFGNWFKKEEPEPPASVKEWLALPRSDL